MQPGGVLFGRGSLFYLLRNRFYIGEVKYKDEIPPGEQPAIMDRALFDAVQQKLTDQWSTRSTIRNASEHLLTGVLFDDANHRMVPTHATKAGIRYRYYVSLPLLYGESKSASVGSVSRISAAGIEETIIKALNEHLIAQKKNSLLAPRRLEIVSSSWNTSRASGALASQRLQYSPDTERNRPGNSRRGNGIFERGDWSLQLAQENVSFSGDRKGRTMPNNAVQIPGRNGLFPNKDSFAGLGKLNGGASLRRSLDLDEAALSRDRQSGAPWQSRRCWCCPSDQTGYPNDPAVAGQEAIVTAIARGFEWNGQTYKSLSAVAKVITGTNWNGYAFFGIKRASIANKNAAGPDRVSPKTLAPTDIRPPSVAVKANQSRTRG